MPKTGAFDMGKFLSDQGLTLNKVTDDGQYEVTDAKGQLGKLNIDKVLKDFSLDSSKIDLQFNTPDSPLDSSPISLGDRAKMAVGNTRGSISYLKTKYEDAALHPENGLLVRNKGVWQKVDQSQMDPWELTKDLVEGAISLVPGAVGSTIGAVKGAALAAPTGPGAIAGAVIGAGVGGAAVEGSMRSLLGRAAGTYQATPEEEFRDIGYDFLLNAGGQGLALGAKPTLKALGTAAKNVVKWAGADKLGATAANQTLDVLADTLGRTTGAGPVAARTLFEQTDDVVKTLGAAKAGAASTQDVLLNLRGKQLQAVESLVKESPTALSKKYVELVDGLVSQVDDSFKVNVGDMVKSAQQKLADAGYGQFVPEGESGQMFKLFTDKEAIAKMMGGGEAKVFDDKTAAALESMSGFFNKFSKVGEVSGKNAARSVMELRKVLNSTARNLTDKDVPPAVKSFVDDFRKALTNEVGAKFHGAGLGEKFAATSNLYERFSDAVTFARRAYDSENGSEVLLNKLVSGIGSNQTYKDFTGEMAELLGDRGKDLLKTIKVAESAKGFAPVLPKLTLGSLTAGSIGAGAAATGAVSAPIAVAGASLASPRLVMKEVVYARKALDFMKNLPTNQKIQWLQNPTVVRETFKSIGEAAISEDSSTEEMLRQAGVK